METQTGEALIAAHRRALRNLRIVSIGFPLAFMGLIVWNLSSIASMIENIDGARVGAELSNRMNELMPDVDDHLGDLAAALEPALFSALESESTALAPQIEERLRADVDHSIASAKGQLASAVQKSLREREEEHRAHLLALFPELAQDPAAQEAVMLAARSAAADWSDAKLDALVAEHLSAMEGLRETLQASYVKSDAQSADPEDALMALLNLMNEHIGGADEVLTAPSGKNPKPAAAAGKKE
jgi:hypothetical protein